MARLCSLRSHCLTRTTVCLFGIYLGWFIFSILHLHPYLIVHPEPYTIPLWHSQSSINGNASTRVHPLDHMYVDPNCVSIDSKEMMDVMEPEHTTLITDIMFNEPTDQVPSIPMRVQLSDFQFNRTHTERTFTAYNTSSHRTMLPLIAYMEPPLSNTLSISNTSDIPQFIVPLPLRTQRPSNLQIYHYHSIRSCKDLPARLPVDGETNQQCPVDMDPFLPWIHDVFPSVDGSTIHFIAQNKRRCNTGRDFQEVIDRLVPQVTIMQPISVQRVNTSMAQVLAPELWVNDADTHLELLPRYRLASDSASDLDGRRTRFVCRFHSISLDRSSDGSSSSETLTNVILGETLSVFPIDYELAHVRKTYSNTEIPIITTTGKDNGKFWWSNFRFECPVPNNGMLREVVSNGKSVLDDIPSLYVDLVPIRTSARYTMNDTYLTEDMVGSQNRITGFDPTHQWGEHHVLPLIEASGRWENVPICHVPLATNVVPTQSHAMTDMSMERIETKGKEDGYVKPHMLIGCVWASASYETRGNARTVLDVTERLREWVEFHLLVGFDHIYIYDNTGAHTNQTSLEATLNIFAPTEVTRIDWPAKVCNNNIPGHENMGERSSQYAADSSCRQRYGPYTEWIGVFDIDEYLVPMGNHTSLRDVVREAYQGGTHILSFKSTRAYPNHVFTQSYYDDKECGHEDKPSCVQKRPDALFLETYNCDQDPIPKPEWATRAKKQLYRPDYVLSHFVHYSTITKGLMTTHAEAMTRNQTWGWHYTEKTERFTDELQEAVMLHGKTTMPGDTKRWSDKCRVDFKRTWRDKCRVGFPFPRNEWSEGMGNEDGFEYNCFTNQRLTEFWIPKLREAMERRAHMWDQAIK